MNTPLTPYLLQREGFLPSVLQNTTVGYYSSELKMFLTIEQGGYLQKEMDRTVKTLGELKTLIHDRGNLNEVK